MKKNISIYIYFIYVVYTVTTAIFNTVFKYEYRQRYTLTVCYYLMVYVTVYAIYEEKYIYIYFLYVVFTVTTAIFNTVFKYEYCRRYTLKFPYATIFIFGAINRRHIYFSCEKLAPIFRLQYLVCLHLNLKNLGGIY